MVDAIGDLARAENAVCARKLAAMAELFCRRTGLTNAEDRDTWWVGEHGQSVRDYLGCIADGDG